MFESLSHRKKDLYDEPSPLNSLNPYQRIGRQVEGTKNTQSLDLTLSEHDLERVRPDKTNQNIFQALALALGNPIQEEHNVLSNVRSELSDFMAYSSIRLPVRLQELRSRKDLWMKIIDNPSQEEYHKVVPKVTKYICDVASLAYKVKVIVCSVSHNSRALNEVIYANRFKEEIRILKTAPGRYEGLQRKQVHVQHNTRAPYNSSVVLV